jgi:hypothetical protein
MKHYVIANIDIEGSMLRLNLFGWRVFLIWGKDLKVNENA